MKYTYALITPARNEEQSIEGTILSVIGQSVLPVRWIIVSDGSTDRTDAIAGYYVGRHQFMELIRMPEHRNRNFAAKVACFSAGYERLRGTDYDIIGNLDADITFEPDYFEFLISKFEEDPKLGVAGTPFVENGVHYDYHYTNIEHVSGACQLFRKECFEDIGGYLPIRGGGIDFVAVTTARMKGWKTSTFTGKTCFHHRKMGTGNATPLMTSFRQGKKDYFLGNHPFWEVFRTFYQMTRKPIVLGGALLMAGFTWAAVTGTQKPISGELEHFIRAEQMTRLKNLVRR